MFCQSNVLKSEHISDDNNRQQSETSKKMPHTKLCISCLHRFSLIYYRVVYYILLITIPQSNVVCFMCGLATLNTRCAHCYPQLLLLQITTIGIPAMHIHKCLQIITRCLGCDMLSIDMQTSVGPASKPIDQNNGDKQLNKYYSHLYRVSVSTSCMRFECIKKRALRSKRADCHHIVEQYARQSTGFNFWHQWHTMWHKISISQI
jgi:hypothetical protein